MYIKTKDGIYKVESETCHKQGYYIDRYEEDVILKKQVIKQSENLEELCDRFVVIDKETKMAQTQKMKMYTGNGSKTIRRKGGRIT